MTQTPKSLPFWGGKSSMVGVIFAKQDLSTVDSQRISLLEFNSNYTLSLGQASLRAPFPLETLPLTQRSIVFRRVHLVKYWSSVVDCQILIISRWLSNIDNQSLVVKYWSSVVDCQIVIISCWLSNIDHRLSMHRLSNIDLQWAGCRLLIIDLSCAYCQTSINLLTRGLG